MYRRVLIVLIVVVGCHRSARDEPVSGATSVQDARVNVDNAPTDAGNGAANVQDARIALPDVKTEWCLDRRAERGVLDGSAAGDQWRGLDEGTCYLLPPGADEGTNPPTRLLIYLAGIVPPVAKSPQKENVQRIVSAAARRAGVAVILPRGRRGIGPTDAKDWWAWPTSPADYQAHAKAMVAEWRAARALLESALGGRPFSRSYLAGSSSGAYFLTALALSGAVDGEFDGYVAASGGATGLGASSSSSSRAGADGGVAKHPFYVGYALGDPTNGGPKALAAYLASAGWPVRVSAIPGGHGAREEYLDEAFAFFDAWEKDSGR